MRMESQERDRLLKRLVGWRPANGILSVYIDVDPGDRRRAWRIALRERLRELEKETPPHEPRRAFEAAAARILVRFPEDGPAPEGRGHVGFVELAQSPNELWRSMQMAPRRVEVVRASRTYVRPLVELFDEGPRVGVALTSADRVRLLEWSLGAIRSIDEWEIVLWSRDWRERKAERSVPGEGEWTSASGRDQFGQRLEANRQRFLREVGGRVAEEHAKRHWRHILAFGVEGHVEELASGLGSSASRLRGVASDLISAPDPKVARRVEEEVRSANRAREEALVEELEEEIGSSRGAALGPQEVLESLGQGRARHLVFDADRDYAGRPLDAGDADRADSEGLPLAERLVELAIETGAEITPMEGDAAARLEPHGGAAALLRY